MTTDKRTNEIRQELAAKLHEMFPGYVWNHYLNAVDALALEAAAGAAPPAPSEYAYCPIHGDLLAANRSYRCGNAPTGHEYAAPVQPSSTVDEAALIREAKAEAWDEAEGEIHKWYATYKATLFTAPENPYREGSD